VRIISLHPFSARSQPISPPPITPSAVRQCAPVTIPAADSPTHRARDRYRCSLEFISVLQDANDDRKERERSGNDGDQDEKVADQVYFIHGFLL
jgi:hypothetical protein